MFNFAAIKATLLNTALNAGIFLVASLAIQGIAKALDNYIHRVENARERTDELFDEFKQMNDTLTDHRKIVSELADRYDELSKGVNLSTNDNVSLSTEEYEEFLDINEQLAQSFPELAKGIDENGNSILTLGTKGITAKEQLEELLQTEEDLNNFRIAQGLEDAFKGVYTYVEDANEATKKLNGTISDSSQAMSKLQDIAENGIRLTGEDGQLIFVGNTNNQAELDYMNSLTTSVNEFWKSLDGSRRMELGIDPSYLLTQNFDEYTGAFEVYANLYNLTPEELTALENIIQDNVGDASGALLDSISDQSQELQEQIQQGENAWRDFIPNLVSGMKSKQTFKDLDSDLQDIAIQIVEGLDYSYATAMKEWNPNDPYAYIRDKLIVPMGDLSDSDKQLVKDSFTKLMTLNPEDISDSNREAISELITKIADILEKDEIEIKVALGFDVGDDAKRRLQSSIHRIADDHGIEDREQVTELNEVTKDFTLSEIELWLEATQGAKNATQAIEMYKDALKKAKGEASDDSIIPTISSSVQQLATQLEPQFAKLGEAYKEIFTADGFTLDEVDNSMLEDLRRSFAEIEEEVGVAFDASVLNPFFDTLTNKSSTVEQVQDAFNNLATAYFYSTDTLEQLNSETADAIEKQLEEMGVQNAAEVVAEALTAKTEELIVAKEYLAQTGEELASATEEEQTAFILEQIEAGNCGEALALLQLKKILVNSTQINTAADIQQIMNLASTAGMGTEVLTQLANAKSIFETVEAGGTVSLASYEKALSDVESAKETMLNWKPVEIDFGNTGGVSSKAGKEAGDAYVNAFEEELEELQRLRNDGVITEKEYLDRLRALYEKYFKDKLGYEKEFSKYQRQYLEGYKSLYESVLSSISKLMSHQIDGYNEAKEAAVSSLTEEKEARLAVIDAQKDQLEAEKDLIDEQIEAKQKLIDDIQNEIDAMKEANSERQRQLDLQKAQYELERMQHQRTILQYSEDKGMHYVANTSGIRDAKDAVDDAKLEIEVAKKEKEIDLIQKEIDLLEKQKDAIQDQIDDLDKQSDQIEKYYSKMISETEKYYDSLISNMEKQKSKWEELAEIEEIAQAYSDLEQVFGDMGYTVQDILNGNEQAFEDFKSKYISLLYDMNSNSSFAEGLSYATGVAEENLGSFLDKTQEAGTGIDELASKAGELGIIAEGMDGLATSATTASESTSAVASSMGELSTNTEGISENITSINNTLTDLPEADKLDDLAAKFTSLGEAIKSVADILGIGEEGAVSTLVTALQDISTLSLDGLSVENGSGGGIISQFNNLKTAVDDVTSAISGGGSSENSTDGDASTSSSPSMGTGAGVEDANGLLGAIEDIKSATDESLGGGKGSENGAIPQFNNLKTAVDDVISTIGIGESEKSGGSENTLIGALRAQYEAVSEVLPEEKTLFEELLSSIEACVSALNNMVSLIGSISKIGGFGIPGTSVIPHAKGTVGNAFYKGTGKYKGLANREHNALLSEYGQTEMTVLPNGKTILTDKPTMMDLPKDTVIFNEDQTKKIMDNKVDASGTAYANGTVIKQSNSNKPVIADDIFPEMDLWQRMEKCAEAMGRTMEDMLNPLNSIAFDIRKETGMGRLLESVNNVNNVTNNNNKPSISIGDINVTCPGVTEQQVAQHLGGVIEKELNKQFSGFHNYVDQQSRIR